MLTLSFEKLPGRWIKKYTVYFYLTFWMCVVAYLSVYKLLSIRASEYGMAQCDRGPISNMYLPLSCVFNFASFSLKNTGKLFYIRLDSPYLQYNKHAISLSGILYSKVLTSTYIQTRYMYYIGFMAVRQNCKGLTIFLHHYYTLSPLAHCPYF